MRITASDVAHITGGLLVGPNCEANGVSFDSRSLRTGQLFVAVTADRDGNEFVEAARDGGASFALVAHGCSVDGLTCVEVNDTTVALAQLGRHYLGALSNTVEERVIGITGSAGKTSTKNLVRAVLSQKYSRVHAAEHSLNNDIGVPVTILNAPDDADAVVLEMGMRGFHEIARLCAIASPTIGVITNIGDAHGERVGGAEGIARAKGELLESLPEHGTAILNADDDVWLPSLRARSRCHILTFGSDASSDLVWSVLTVDDFGVVTAQFDFRGESCVITPALPGVHMVANAAAAVLVGVACGLTFTASCSGIGTEGHEFGRMVWLENNNGQRILDDSYNANEASMLAALRVVETAAGASKIAVLGRMAEVADPQLAHQRIAHAALAAGITLISLETDLYGLPSHSLEEVMNIVNATAWDVMLVKGSRSAATERVIKSLVTQ